MIYIKAKKIHLVTLDFLSKGFTLIEVMSALVISGILLSIAVPSMNNFLMNQRLNDAQEAIVRGIALAQSNAKRYKETWAVTLTLEGDQYVVGAFPLSDYTLPLTTIPADVYDKCSEDGVVRTCSFTKLARVVEQKPGGTLSITGIRIDPKGHFDPDLLNGRFKVRIKNSAGGTSYGIRCVFPVGLLGATKIEDSATTGSCN
jgi:prepilin-type N-terminal cleavage/methylation domain-containing protein